MRLAAVLSIVMLVGAGGLEARAQGLDQIFGPLFDGGGQPSHVRRVYVDPKPSRPVGRRQRSRQAEAPAEPPMDAGGRMRIQAGLAAMGFYDGSVDGQIGPASRQAIARFQESVGAEPTGFLTAGQVKQLEAVAGDRDAPAAEAADDEQADAPAQPEASEEGDVQAAVQTAPAGGGRDKALGIATFNGDILVGSGVIGRGRDMEGILKLAMLLVLKGRPELLDDPEQTIRFTGLLPRKTNLRRFLDDQMGELRWKGTNQFQVEDSRLAFLAAYKQKILGMVPELPLTIADARGFGVGTYDAKNERLGIGISDYEAWDSLNFVSFEAPLPMTLPESWKLPPAAARSVVEAVTGEHPEALRPWKRQFGAGYSPGATALLRYQVKAVRPTERGVVLDLAALDISVYDQSGLTHKIGTLPLPADAIRADQPEAAARDTIPFLDPILPRLIAAHLKPDLLENDAFLRETFRIRREMERGIKEGGTFNAFPRRTNWPRLVSSAALNTQIDPSAAELSETRAWIEANAARVGTTVTQPNVCAYLDFTRDEPGSCNLAGRMDEARPQFVKLDELLDFTDFNWDYTRMSTDWVDSAIAASKTLLPDSFDVRVLPSGNDIPTLVAMQASPSWYGVEVPFAPTNLAQASLDLDLASSQLRQDAGGRGFLLLQVQPKAIRYTPSGGSETVFPLAVAPQPAKDAGSVGTFDILGIKLGMNLDDAVKALEASTPGTSWSKSTYSIPDPVLSQTLVLTKAPAGTAQEASSGEERVILFYDDLPGKPLLAAGRYLNYSASNFGSDEDAMKALQESLAAKYGTPYPEHPSKTALVWAVDDVTVARLKAEMQYDDPCSLFPYRNFADNPSEMGEFGGQSFDVSCGEMLRADILRETMQLFLFDTGRAKLKAQRLASQSAPAPKPPAPKIKF